MTLNKSKGNMYSWTTHTWNPIRGKCPHGCVYCFMKDRDVGDLRLDEKALVDNLGSGRTIFVGSSTDMWAMAVPHALIFRVLEKCNKHQNTYIFQSKDPGRFCYSMDMLAKFPPQTILEPTLDKEGKARKHQYIDEGQLELIPEKARKKAKIEEGRSGGWQPNQPE